MSINRAKEYVQFRANVPRKRITVGRELKEWSYFEVGAKDSPALVMLHGTSGTADMYFYQILHLCSKGYRVISAQYPAYWTHADWVKGFHMFLAEIGVRRVHVLGSSLGGFLALHYVATHPSNVASLVLCNSFCDTVAFSEQAPCLSMLPYMPEFYLKKFILDSFPRGQLPINVADAVDFAVIQLESLHREALASRLTLNCVRSVVHALPSFDTSKITIIDALDDVVLPNNMRQHLYDTFAEARQSFMKSGGDFPFLSCPDEFSMHLQVHLRRQGLYPDMKVEDAISKHFSDSTDNWADEHKKKDDDDEVRAFLRSGAPRPLPESAFDVHNPRAQKIGEGADDDRATETESAPNSLADTTASATENVAGADPKSQEDDAERLRKAAQEAAARKEQEDRERREKEERERKTKEEAARHAERQKQILSNLTSPSNKHGGDPFGDPFSDEVRPEAPTSAKRQAAAPAPLISDDDDLIPLTKHNAASAKHTSRQEESTNVEATESVDETSVPAPQVDSLPATHEDSLVSQQAETKLPENPADEHTASVAQEVAETADTEVAVPVPAGADGADTVPFEAENSADVNAPTPVMEAATESAPVPMSPRAPADESESPAVEDAQEAAPESKESRKRNKKKKNRK